MDNNMKKQSTPSFGIKKILDFKKISKKKKKQSSTTKLIQGRQIDFFDYIC